MSIFLANLPEFVYGVTMFGVGIWLGRVSKRFI